MRLRHVLLAACLGAALLVPTVAFAGTTGSATFTKTSNWNDGFVANYEIKNTGSEPMVGWKLEFDVPAGVTVTSAWSGKLSGGNGHYVLTDEAWTRTIAPGASVKVGFQGTHNGSFAGPTNCKLNGQPCAGGSAPPPPPAPDTQAPSAPSGLTAGTPTPTTVGLSWNAASDNVGVTGYEVYRDGAKILTTTNTDAAVSGLTPETSYSFSVRALDAAGNRSATSSAVSVRTPAAPVAASPTATFTKTEDWGSGYNAAYTIRTPGPSPINGWRLEFDLRPGESVTSAWDSKLSVSGNHYVLTDEHWTHTIAAGASVTAGFGGSYSGTFEGPKNCKLNGQPCAGGPSDTQAPAAPAGLAAGTPTSSSVPLSWKAATDNVAVTGYEVYRGDTKVAATTATEATVAGLAPDTSYSFTVRALDAAGNHSAASNAVSVKTAAAPPPGGGGGSASVFAPYFDMTLQSRDVLGADVSGSGINRVTLAFIVSKSTCEASWGGFYGLDHSDSWFDAKASIAAARSRGAEPLISFGGAAGQELARTCTTVNALAAQYQLVIDTYGVRELDYDVEGADQGDAPSLERRFKAVAKVQADGRAAGKPVKVSLTLPVMPTGLTQTGLGVVRAARDNGVEVELVNVMAMDYFDPSLDYRNKMGDYAIQAATATRDQLATLYPGRSDAELWKMVGVTPMIGINDNPAEVFTTADAEKLAAFAAQKGIGRLAIWSLNRDRPCPGPTSTTGNYCSGTPQTPYQFSKTLGG